jgi:predicted MFS family arabinose efflux permease
MTSISQSDTPLPIDRTRRAVLISALLVVTFLYWTALYLYVPTLPLYIQTKTPDLALIGTALSMYGLWQVVSRLPLGICLDWAGRSKPFLVAWLLLAALGDWMLGSAGDIGSATLGRAVIGVAAGCWVPLVVVFSGLFEPSEIVRATAIISTVGTGSRILATAANGWLNALGGYPLAFKVAAGAALLAAGIALTLPDVRRTPRAPSFAGLWSLARRREVLLPSLLQGLIHTGDFAATFTFIPILARLKGASDVTIGLLLSLDLTLALLGNMASAPLARRLGSRGLAALSIALMAAGIALSAIAPNLMAVFLAQVLVGFSFGAGYPLFMGLSIEKIDAAGGERTTAMGMHQSIYSLGMFAGPWLAGQLASAFSISGMFLAVAGLLLLAGLPGVWALRRPG